ncbi:MAG: protein-methionine-sulfoxide reductase heme-binding subunit MsrQ [Alphaproteobacteria bacterium]|nr:protein-methionine-sulfoxide reductase heme-binding subunit MsrQ [Alphaproteobacteria bacterium]
MIWRRYDRLALYVAGFIPALYLFYAAFSGWLGADPTRVLEHHLGLWALRFLIAALCVTPLRNHAGINLLRYRRAFGLLCFAYAALHFLTYVVLDQGLDLSAIWRDITRRWFITIGMAALLMLVPLTLTSNNAMIKRLGARAWGQLHTLTYAIAVAVIVHYILSVKSWPAEPLIYAAIVGALLLYRIVRTLTKRWRPRPGPIPRPA